MSGFDMHAYAMGLQMQQLRWAPAAVCDEVSSEPEPESAAPPIPNDAAAVPEVPSEPEPESAAPPIIIDAVAAPENPLPSAAPPIVNDGIPDLRPMAKCGGWLNVDSGDGAYRRDEEGGADKARLLLLLCLLSIVFRFNVNNKARLRNVVLYSTAVSKTLIDKSITVIVLRS